MLLLINNNTYSDQLTMWTLDSGTSVNITDIPELLMNKKKHEETIYFANGKHVTSTYIGDVKRFVNNNKITLYNKVIISRTVNIFEHLPANFYFNNTIPNIPYDQIIIINDTQYNNTNINNNHNLTTMNSDINKFDNLINNNSISNYQFQNTPQNDNSKNIPNTTIFNSIINTYTDINNNNNNTSNFNNNNENNIYSFYNFIDNNYILNNPKRKKIKK